MLVQSNYGQDCSSMQSEFARVKMLVIALGFGTHYGLMALLKEMEPNLIEIESFWCFSCSLDICGESNWFYVS